MLALLSETDIPAQVKKVSGRNLAIYFFLSFHVQRAVGKPSVFSAFAKNFPDYELDGQGNLIRMGTFLSARPISSKIYEIVKKWPLLERAVERVFDTPSEQDIMITARIIEESRNKFEQKFPNGEFVVVFYPGSIVHINVRLKPYLEKAGIKYFDYSKLADVSKPENRLYDGHPTGLVHRAVARQLAKNLAGE